MRDMRKQPKPQPNPEPKPEPKELNWSERELQITTDAIEARRAIGVHEVFLTGLLREQAEQQKMVDEQRGAGTISRNPRNIRSFAGRRRKSPVRLTS